MNAASPSQIDGSFDSSGTAADGFLVVKSTSSSLSSNPSDGTNYSSGDALGGGTVVRSSSDTDFSATGLNSGTTYYFFVFAYDSAACTGGPSYKTPGLQGNESTPTPCSTPLQQAKSLTLNDVSTSSIEGAFDSSNTGADGFLVVRSNSASLSSLPSNGSSYSNGDALGGGTVVKASTDTSFVASSLNPNTLYYFFIFAYNDAGCYGGPKYLTPSLKGHEATQRSDGYCAAIAHPGSGEHIKKVSIENIDNTSGKEPKGYGDYSNLSTELSKNKSHTLEVTIDTDGDTTAHVHAWIDLDQDQNFQQPDEKFDLGDATNASSAVLSSSISLPSSASLGNTIMRIVQSSGSDPGPCLEGFAGEVEDYTVEIVDRSGIAKKDQGISMELFPNPNDGTFKISVPNPDRKDLEITVFDPKGNKVYQRSHGPRPLDQRKIDLKPDAAEGNYLIRLKVGDELVTRKFLVEDQ